VTYDTVELIHAVAIYIWVACLFGAFIFSALMLRRAPDRPITGATTVVRLSTRVGLPAAVVLLITGLWMAASGEYPPGDGLALVAGTILWMIVVVIGGAFMYSAASKMHKAAQGSDEAIRLARRIVLIVGIQFILVLLATIRGIWAKYG